MASFNSYPQTKFEKLQDTLKNALANCAFYEQAAQTFTSILFDEFSPNVVLSRMYFTIPYKALPKFNKNFVDNLVKAKGVAHLLKPETPVLSLVGSSGKKAGWRDRQQSQGHVGIPLCSADFINEIPMMSRLLQEIGVSLSWFDQQDLSLVEKSLTGMSGIFHVFDASHDIDARGRKIISAQDFVTTNGINTVFGMGTNYIGGTFVVSILFTNESINQKQIKNYVPLMNIFRGATSKFVNSGSIFIA